MLTDNELQAKMIRLGRRWARSVFDKTPTLKNERIVKLLKKLNSLDKEYLKRKTR
jgi:hypothetical protein